MISTNWGKVIRIIVMVVLSMTARAQQGSWTAITQNAPHPNYGVMLLLTDGSVITVTTELDTTSGGNRWDKLTPDSNGSYINGTWSSIASMNYSRYPFSSQVLRDGNVYIAGSEFGSGTYTSELYNSKLNTWTNLTSTNVIFWENNSMMLRDGRVLQAMGDTTNNRNCVIFNPQTNAFDTAGSAQLGGLVEASWVLLPDESILMVDYWSLVTERYIPSLNRWIPDTPVPAGADLYGNSVEMGAGFMLPDGRAFFLGASGHTAYYTPTGDTTMGSWLQGPEIPDSLGTLDAPASMMVNGKILLAASPLPSAQNGYYPFNTPTFFYEFDYLTNTYTKIVTPGGGDSINQQSEILHMLNLPDGSVLYSQDSSSVYYVYTPAGAPLSAGKPTINSIIQYSCDSFAVTGTLFNGISQGAAFGDDWQMATNYPLVRLSMGTTVYYARTSGWNRTGIQTGNLPDTTEFTVPFNLPVGVYSLSVIANGISSDSVSFNFNPCTVGIKESDNSFMVDISPNPFTLQTTISFTEEDASAGSAAVHTIKVIDVIGSEIKTINFTGKQCVIENGEIKPGVYFIEVASEDGQVMRKKMVVQ